MSESPPLSQILDPPLKIEFCCCCLIDIVIICIISCKYWDFAWFNKNIKNKKESLRYSLCLSEKVLPRPHPTPTSPETKLRHRRLAVTHGPQAYSYSFLICNSMATSKKKFSRMDTLWPMTMQSQVLNMHVRHSSAVLCSVIGCSSDPRRPLFSSHHQLTGKM